MFQRDYSRRRVPAGLLWLCLMPSVFCAPTAWVVSSMDRVGQTDTPGTSGRADIMAGRGEYESFQVVVRAGTSALTNVNVSVADLTGPGGAVIPKANFTLYREHYVYVSQGSADLGGPNRPHGAGWYPDALIPFKDPVTGAVLHSTTLQAVPFSLGLGANQPIWVDVFVPRDTIAGVYTSTLTVTSDQGTVAVPVSVTVWNFTLPVTPSLKSSFQYWGASGVQMDKNAQIQLLKHRLMPMSINPGDAAELMADYGLNIVGLPFFSGANYSNCSMNPGPLASDIQKETAQYPAGLATYIYTADEIDSCPGVFSTVRQWAAAGHQAGTLSLVTMVPNRNLFYDGTGSGRSAVDLWAVQGSSWDAGAGSIAQAVAKGDTIWTYNGNPASENYSPKWTIDFDLIDARVQPGFINQGLGAKGLLYWRVDRWNLDAWNDVNNLDVFGQGYNFPGEGMLVYPGGTIGATTVAPSMRLKQMRDGVEDYEYIEMLKKLGRGDWALQVAKTAGSDWHNWTHSPAVLQSVRVQLGQELDRLSAANAAANESAIAGVAAPVRPAAAITTASLLNPMQNKASSATLSASGYRKTIRKPLSVVAAGAGIALVQSNSTMGSSVSSVSAAFTNANSAGNLIVAFVRMSTTTQTVTMSDTAGNSYAQAVAQTQTADGHQIRIFYAKNIGGKTNTVTATFSAANGHPWLAIYEYSGLSTTNPLDRTTAAQGSSTAANTSATAQTSVGGELMFVGLGLPSSFTGTVTAGSGFTLAQQNTATSRAAGETSIASSTGAYSGALTLSAAANWSAAIATFIPAVSVTPPAITTSSLPKGPQNAPYTAALAASGGVTPYTWSLSAGTLPAGLALNSTTGVISGTPTAISSNSFTVQVKDAASQTATRAFSITVFGLPAIATASLPNAVQNTAYSTTLAASGGTTPYQWSITSGSLPAGLTLTAASGIISGTPTATGTFNFTVQVKDANQQIAAKALGITVTAATGTTGINLIQSNSTEGSSATSIAVTFTKANSTGNLIVAVVRMSTSTQTVTISDTAGNTYAQAVAQTQMSDGHQIRVFYAKNIAAKSNIVTATFSAANGHPWMSCMEYSGLSTTAPLGPVTGASADGATSLTTSTVTTGSPVLLVGAWGLPYSSTAAVTASTGFTKGLEDTGTSRGGVELRTINTAGTYAAAVSLSTAASGSIALATFVQQPVAVTAPPPSPAPATTSGNGAAVVYYGASMTDIATIASAPPELIVLNFQSYQYSDAAWFATASPSLKKVGTKVLAYINTCYANTSCAWGTDKTLNRSVSQVEGYVASAVAAGADGIFFDEGSVIPSVGSAEYNYYKAIYDYVKSFNSNLIVINNPGWAAITEYNMLTADIVDLETDWPNFTSSWKSKYNPRRFLGQTNQVASLSDALTSRTTALADGIGMFYPYVLNSSDYGKIDPWWTSYIAAIPAN